MLVFPMCWWIQNISVALDFHNNQPDPVQELKTKSSHRTVPIPANQQKIIASTPHMLRHTYCSNLYRAGIDLKTAQYLMGHSSIDMTANVYTHLSKEDVSSSITRLEEYLAGGSQDSQKIQKVVKR